MLKDGPQPETTAQKATMFHSFGVGGGASVGKHRIFRKCRSIQSVARPRSFNYQNLFCGLPVITISIITRLYKMRTYKNHGCGS